MKKYIIFSILIISSFLVAPKVNASISNIVSVFNTNLNPNDTTISGYDKYNINEGVYFTNYDLSFDFSDMLPNLAYHIDITFYGTITDGWYSLVKDYYSFYYTNKYNSISLIEFINFKSSKSGYYNTISFDFILPDDLKNNTLHFKGLNMNGILYYSYRSNSTFGLDSISISKIGESNDVSGLIEQNDIIINQNQNFINNQKETNNKLDDIYDSDLSDNDKEQVDDTTLNEYENAENDVLDQINDVDLDNIDISMDVNSTNFIWDLITDIFNSHPVIMSTVIAILSIGIIKLALGR